MSTSLRLFLVDLTVKSDLLGSYLDAEQRGPLLRPDAERLRAMGFDPVPTDDDEVTRQIWGTDLTDDELVALRAGNFEEMFRLLTEDPRPTSSGDAFD